MHRYEITVRFATDRELTLEELNTLRDTIALQVEEPQDLEGNEAEFRTHTINVA